MEKNAVTLPIRVSVIYYKIHDLERGKNLLQKNTFLQFRLIRILL
jgi:hypothetical protein